MPTVGVGVTEMDAAEALLELRFDRDSPPNGERPSRDQPIMFRNEMESTDTAALSLNIGVKFESPNSSRSSPTVFTLDNGNGFIIRKNPSSISHYKHLKPPKKRSSYRKKEKDHKRWNDAFSFSTPNTPQHNGFGENINRTLEKSTQTEIEYQLPQIQKMESVITDLCAKIRSLEDQLKAGQQSNVEGLDDSARNSSRKSYERKAKKSETMASKIEFEVEPWSCEDDQDSDYTAESNKDSKESPGEEIMSDNDDHSDTGRSYIREDIRNISCEMVPIGEGNAIVPARLMRQLDWSSYTNVTRKLLTAVFSRRVLATHSLTGKRSPAFPDKPAKKKLNQALVSDIIQTVVERCNVPENVVRVSITTKCADESKMLRTRNKKRCSIKKENIPPRNSTSSNGSIASRV